MTADVHAKTGHGVQLLEMHHHAPVAIDDDDPPVWSRDRRADRRTERLADRTERVGEQEPAFGGPVEILDRKAATMAASDHHDGPRRQRRVEGGHH